MDIETTVNIKKILLERLESASAQLGLPKSRIVSLLFQRVKQDKELVKIFSRIAYQKRDKSASWKRLHVSLRFDVYELCQDLRKLFKMSISFILAYAIENYLDELLKVDNTDNYGGSYFLFLREVEGFTNFYISWELPDERIVDILLE